MALMAATGLGKRFGEHWVFRDVEFEVAKGDVLCVLGPNGCGKSTLLRVLASLTAPSAGRVSCGSPLGYAAVDLALWPQLTAVEHLRLAAELRGIATDPVAELARVGLAGAEHKPTGQFSSGMRARLKLALAVQHAPEVLLLDEPSATLDDRGRELVVQTVAEQRARGAVVIATNEQADRRLATHVLELG